MFENLQEEEVWAEVVVQVVADEKMEHITPEGNALDERRNSSHWTFLGCLNGSDSALAWQLIHIA